MTDVRIPFSDLDDIGEAARQLLQLAGDDPDQVRTHDDAFVVSEEFAHKHGLEDKDGDGGYELVDEPEDENEDEGDSDSDTDPDAPVPFDPSAHNVDDVEAHLDKADADERARVLAAEAAGKKRKTVLEWHPAGE